MHISNSDLLTNNFLKRGIISMLREDEIDSNNTN